MELIVKIDDNVNPDRLAIFIAEKCRQDGVDFDLKVNGKVGRKMIEEQRKTFSKPIEIGEKIAVKILTARTKHFGFEPYESDRIVAELEPKSSAGTGLHETTRMCIEALEKHIKKNCTVLDVGCGTGILSVSALLLGAKSAVGVDCNGSSVDVARDTAKRNGVADRYTAIHGNLADKVEGKFDVVVANILTDQIKELLQGIKSHMNKDGVLILSGIADFRLGEVIEAAKDFEIIQKQTSNNWCCLGLKQK